MSKCTSSVLYINSLISYLYPVHLYVIQDYVFFLNGIFYRICIELFQLLYFSLRRWRFGHMEQTVFMYRGEASWQAQLKKVLPDTRLDNEWGNWYSKRIRGVYGVYRHYQQYFSYIVAVSFIVEETGGPGENHWPVVSHWQTEKDDKKWIDLTTDKY